MENPIWYKEELGDPSGEGDLSATVEMIQWEFLCSGFMSVVDALDFIRKALEEGDQMTVSQSPNGAPEIVVTHNYGPPEIITILPSSGSFALWGRPQ